jgi:hypothetical protein
MVEILVNMIKAAANSGLGKQTSLNTCFIGILKNKKELVQHKYNKNIKHPH